MESGDEDDAFTMGEREWQKMQRNLSKQGYREGKSDGREKSMQDSFEKAASLSLKYSEILGQLVGILEMEIISLSKLPSNNEVKMERLNRLVQQVDSYFNDMRSNETESIDGSIFEQKWKNILADLNKQFILVCPEQAHLLSKLYTLPQ